MIRRATVLSGLLAVASLSGAHAQTVDGASAPGRCQLTEPHPDAPPEVAQFSFLVGDYEITSHIMTPNGWSPPRPGPRARWNGWYGLGGMAIYDEWFDPDPAEDPSSPRGVNVRMYDPQAAVWKMMWVATGAAQVQDLRAEMREGKVTMWQVYPDRADFLADFTVEDEDHWHRVSYTKGDDDEWVPQYKLAATRVPCGRGGS